MGRLADVVPLDLIGMTQKIPAAHLGHVDAESLS
jgi:hypothetical protein